MAHKYENLCQLPLSADLFCQAIHPSAPVVAVGLSSGHVQSFRLPSDDSDDDEARPASHGGTIATQWSTRRHKGSCRALGFSADGDVLYSAGTDSLLKAFSSTTGQVSAKLHIPSCNGSPDHPTLLHALSPQTLLLATDSAALHLLDLRTPGAFASAAPAQTHRPHDDYISSLAPLPATAASTSGVAKQWVTTGGTTLAVTDLRRGVLVKSADQEEELLSCAVVGGFPAHGGQSGGQKVVVGNGNGVLTLWERGVWDDQDERVVVTPGGKAAGESVDAIAVVPGGRREVVVGCGDGKVRVVNLTGRGVLGVLRHDELEGVVGVGFDCYGRLISGGGNMVKVWGEKGPEAGEGEEESDSEKDSEKDSEDSEDESSSSEEEEKPERKKRKKGRGKADPGVGNGILGFQGMD